MIKTESGDLNKRITFEALTQTKDAQGGIVDSWVNVATVWASVRHLSGNERQLTNAGGGQVAQARTEFVIRHRSDIVETMRVLFNGKKYNIQHINNIYQADEFIVINCDTGTNDGR